MPIEAVSDIRRAGVSAFASGGGAGSTVVLITITPVAFDNVTTTIADVLVTAGTTVRCALHPNADFDADELSDVEVFGAPGAVAGTLAITICSSIGPLVGTYRISYTLE